MRSFSRHLCGLTLLVGVLVPGAAEAQGPATISLGGAARRSARAAAVVTAASFIKTTENGQQCTTITFEGLADQAPVPTIEGINSLGWLSLIDADAGGNGNFANEPSPETIMFWLGSDPSIVIDKPASKIEFYYSTSVTLIVTAFDKDNNQIAQITRQPNFSGGPGDPTGQYSVWTPLTVEVPGKKIKQLNVVGGPNFTGFDNLKVCNSIAVDSVELTQAIQQWQSLDDLKTDLQGDREAPVPVIAGKPAALRVYFEEVPNVTQVTVEVSGAVSGSRTLSLQPQCTAEAQRKQEGGCGGANFYFTPPEGDFDVTVNVRDAGGTLTDTHNLPFKARETNALKLKAVSICDAKDAAGGWLCASAASLASRIGVLRKIAPTSSVSVQVTASQVRRETSTFATVDDWWNAAIGDVANLHNILDSISSIFGTSVRYYGMIRPALPGSTGGMANDIPGKGAGSRSSVTRLGVETASEVVAHETGHMLGLRHTNTGVPGAGGSPPGCYNTAVDRATNWPFADNRIQSAARLEVGFDVVARRTLDPQNTFEIMSYCVPRWISPQRYKMLIAALGGGAVTSTSAVAAVVPAWLVSGTIDDSVSFDPLFTIDAELEAGEGTHRIEVLDGSGAVLAVRPFTPYVPDAESAESPATGPPRFSVLVPQPPGAAGLVVRSASNEILGTLALGGSAPTVQLLVPSVPGFLSGDMLLTWAVTDADSSSHTTRVHYSADGGETWSELGMSDSNELLVDFDGVPGGASASLRLIVSDGINSTTETFGPFTTPKKSTVTAEILSPANDAIVEPGLLFVEGVGTDIDDGALSGSSLEWSSDKAGPLGSGELLGVDLAPGTHIIQLKATDSDGNTNTAQVRILVAGAAPMVDLTTEALDTLPTTCMAATIDVAAAGLPSALVEYSLDGGQTWTTVPIDQLPYRFIVPGSGFFHMIARAFDAAGQSTADGEQFFTSATCNQQIDLTPPEITPTVTGTFGNNDWYVSEVTVTWLVTDPESGITDSTGCEPTTVTADTAGLALTCTATNGTGLTTTETLTFRIDRTPPVFGPAADVVAEAVNSSGAAVTYALPAVADDNGVSTPMCVPAPGSTFPLGSTPVECFASDDAGNAAQTAFNVTVRDTIAPTIMVPADVTAPALRPAGAPISYAATALDAVGGIVPVTCAPPSGSTFPIGATTVTCAASDAAGNAAQAHFTVTVTDEPTPGLMLGGGRAEHSGNRYRYRLFVGEISSGLALGSLELSVCEGPPRGRNHVFDRCGDDRDRIVGPARGGDSTKRHRFESTSLTFVRFSDDPSFVPGRSSRHQTLVDTVVFAGNGRWNGKSGYTFEARMTDRGEPGRNLDTFEVIIKDPDGGVIVSVPSTKVSVGGNQSVWLPWGWDWEELHEMRRRHTEREGTP